METLPIIPLQHSVSSLELATTEILITTHFCNAHGEGSIFLRDYDGDGDLDIIDVGPGGATPNGCASSSIFLNNGTGVFSELAVDLAWVQGPQVEGWETWQDSGAARST